jgi:hypothetical protein
MSAEPAWLDFQVLSHNKAELAHRCDKGALVRAVLRRRHEEGNAVDAPRLLRPRRTGRGEQAKERSDKLAPPHFPFSGPSPASPRESSPDPVDWYHHIGICQQCLCEKFVRRRSDRRTNLLN